MANECSQVNANCVMKQGNPCPAYDTDKSCWEYDWVPVFKQMAKEDQKKWKSYMLEVCPQCAAYREPMKKMIERIEKEIQT